MTSSAEQGIAAAMDRSRAEINARLASIVDALDAPSDILEAIRYTLLDGGKRLRPMLCLWTHDALGGNNHDVALDVGCAIECMHTYSLVHDDLPCMDDDDLRRGKASTHKEFGEAIAVLTGDALLNLCYEVLGALGSRWDVDDGLVIQTFRIVARAGGTGGLITGQALDLASATLEPTLATVDRIHGHKTAALIAAAMEGGGVVSEAGETAVRRTHKIGEMVGRAFQITDDILDVEMDEGTLGKTPGKDAKDGKLTYPTIAGLEAARQRADELIDSAVVDLVALVRGPEGERLKELLLRFVSRTK